MAPISHEAGHKLAAIFLPQAREHFQCIANTMKNKQCRAEIGKACSDKASWLAAGLLATQALDEGIRTILKLLVCGRHGEQHIGVQMDNLHKVYGPELVKFAQSQPDRMDRTPQPSDRNSKMSVRVKFKSPNTSGHFSDGFLYAFTSEFEPGLVKIGCCRNYPAQRIRQWNECYPK